MKSIKILSWNVNGLRAIYKKGFMDWINQSQPDILCVQETKAHEEQLPDPLKIVEGYSTYFASAEKKGYSGVGLYSKKTPRDVSRHLGVEKFDNEGRTLIADYEDFILFNIYFPNGKASSERLAYKMEFYKHFLSHLNRLLDEGKKIVVCGDVNTAHTEKDIARPKENENASGFLPEERAWIDDLLSSGFIDTYRMFESEGGHYSWWDYKTRARERNVGWRIDYFFVSESLKDCISAAYILDDVMGSDHCPVGIEVTRV